MNRSMGKLMTFLSLVLLVCIGACKQDAKVPQIDYDLEGNWDIYEAYRNKKLTTTLEDGYFTFSDSIMETNIVGSPVKGAIRLTENQFEHVSELPIRYIIDHYSVDTLHLSTEIQGYEFLFKLNRAADTIPENIEG